MRSAKISRKTNETKIELILKLDGEGKSEINTGIGFLNHMLELFSYHGSFDLKVEALGDLDVDYHHTVEDIGICLGLAFDKALDKRAGIMRYASFITPMDESLVRSVIDISGRPYLSCKLDFSSSKVGDIDCELFSEFFKAFTNNAKITLHLDKLKGSNNHHIIEAAFKCFAKTLSFASSINPKNKDIIPSTKGSL